MGAAGLIATIQRLVARQRSDLLYSDVFNFKPAGQTGVRLFTSKTILPLTYCPGLSVRDVCEQAAQKVGILPLNLPFFTLVTLKGGHVLNLQKNLTQEECNEDYEFRLVFKGCTASRFADPGSKDVGTLEYLFFQCQYDFLQSDENITFHHDETDGYVNFAKLVISEIIYQARQRSITPSTILDNLKKYRMQPLLQRGIFSGRSSKEVRKYLKGQIPKLDKLKDFTLKREYIHTVEQADDYFVHKFTVNKIETSRIKGSSNVEYELLISSQFGIKKRKQSDLNAEVVVDKFSEVVNLEIDQVNDTKLTIFRSSSQPQVLFTSSPKDAQSIVAIIDGYYKLLVNRYKNLINQERQPSLKIHGPINRTRAESKVQNIGTDDGLYLLRRCSELFDEYRLSLYYDKQFLHYKILREDGQFELKETTLKRRFPDLNEFMEYYEETQDGLVCCLKQNCPPTQQGFDALLDNQPDVPTSERPQDLTQFGLESIDCKTIRELTVLGMGKGEYGKVIKAEWKINEKENPLDIAIRLVKKERYEKEFFSVEKKLMELRNPNVIQCHGIVRLKASLGLVMEFASESLEHYLKSAIGKLTIKHVMQFAAQIAEGMMYLQDMECVHGRLCAHNVLMAPEEGNIKISDVGLLDLKSHGGKFLNGCSTVPSHCWYALELLIDGSTIRPTHKSDIWSLGVTIWEMFTFRKPFHSQHLEQPLSREQILRMLTIRHKYLDIERDSIPKAVAEIIEKCWDRRPEERISFKDIANQLRDLFINKVPSEVCKSLLVPDEKFVESWERNDVDDESAAASRPTELVLDSESNNYSIMATDQSAKKETACKSCLTGPHDGASSNHGNISSPAFPIPRKQSVQRTLSNPVSPTHLYEEPLEKKMPHSARLARKSFLLPQNDRLIADGNQQNTPPEREAPQTDEPAPTEEDVVGYQSWYSNPSNIHHHQDVLEGNLSTEPLQSQSTHSSLEQHAMEFLQKLNLQQRIHESTNSQATTSSNHDKCYKESSFQTKQYAGDDQPRKDSAEKSEQNMTDTQHDTQDAMQQQNNNTVAPSGYHDGSCNVNAAAPSTDSELSPSSETVNVKFLHDEGLHGFVQHHFMGENTSSEESSDNPLNSCGNNIPPLTASGYIQHDVECNTREEKLVQNEGLHGFVQHHFMGENTSSEESSDSPLSCGSNMHNANSGYIQHHGARTNKDQYPQDKTHSNIVDKGDANPVDDCGMKVQYETDSTIQHDFIEQDIQPNTKEEMFLHDEGLHGFVQHHFMGENTSSEESSDNPLNSCGSNMPPLTASGYIQHDVECNTREEKLVQNEGLQGFSQHHFVEESSINEVSNPLTTGYIQHESFGQDPHCSTRKDCTGFSIPVETIGHVHHDIIGKSPVSSSNFEQHNISTTANNISSSTSSSTSMKGKVVPSKPTGYVDHSSSSTSMQGKVVPSKPTGYVDHSSSSTSMQGKVEPSKPTGYVDHSSSSTSMQGKVVPSKPTGYVDHSSSSTSMQGKVVPSKPTGYVDHSSSSTSMQGKVVPSKTTGYVDHSSSSTSMQGKVEPSKPTGYVDHSSSSTSMQGKVVPSKPTGYVDHSSSSTSMQGKVVPSKLTGYVDHSSSSTSMQGKVEPSKPTGYVDHSSSSTSMQGKVVPSKPTGYVDHSSSSTSMQGKVVPSKPTGYADHSSSSTSMQGKVVPSKPTGYVDHSSSSTSMQGKVVPSKPTGYVDHSSSSTSMQGKVVPSKPTGYVDHSSSSTSMQGKVEPSKPTGYVDHSSVLKTATSVCKEPVPANSISTCEERGHCANGEPVNHKASGYKENPVFGGWHCNDSPVKNHEVCALQNVVRNELNGEPFLQNPFDVNIEQSPSEGPSDELSELEQADVSQNQAGPFDFPQNPFASDLQTSPLVRSDCNKNTINQDIRNGPQNLDPSEGACVNLSFESANEPDQTACVQQKADGVEASSKPHISPCNPFVSSTPHAPSEEMEMINISSENDMQLLIQDPNTEPEFSSTCTTTTVIESQSSSLEDQDIDGEIERQRKKSMQELKEEVKQTIPRQNLKFNKQGILGQGNFGVVRSGVLLTNIKRNQPLKTAVAIKELCKTANDKSQDDFIKEAINMSKLESIKNDNIIRFIGVCIDDNDKVMIVTELAAKKDLKSYLKKEKDKMTKPVLVDFCTQICNGMVELEKHKILHRDLALRNILVVTEDRVKISDFGLSRISEYYKAVGGKWPLKWYAPESLERHKFTSKSDVWSYGVTVWEMFSFGSEPLSELDTDAAEILDYIKKGNRLQQPDYCPDNVYKIMQECWLVDEDERGVLTGDSRPSFYMLYNKFKELISKSVT